MLDAAPAPSPGTFPDPTDAGAGAGAGGGTAVDAARVADGGAALMLAVLTGRLAGAERDLAPGRSVTIGHALDRDVVLRGPDTTGIAATLLPADDGLDAAVRVDAGAVRLLGRRLTAGETLRLPPYLPLWFGDYAVAIGRPGDARWTDAREAAAREADAGLLPTLPDMADGPEARPPAVVGGRLRQWTGRWRDGALAIAPRAARSVGRPAAMVVMGLALLAVSAIPPALDGWRQWNTGPEAVMPALKAAGFGDLSVSTDPTNGAVVVRGMVADSAAERRLRALVAERWDGARIDVQTPASLAGGIAAMLKAKGLDADVAPAPGGVSVTTAYMPADAVGALKADIGREWPMARQVAVRVDEARGAGPLAYFFPPARYGEAAYVEAAISYIATGDGRHWYPGAVLPSGHVLTALGGGAATVRRGAHTERVIVGMAPAIGAPTVPRDIPLSPEPVPGDDARAATPSEVTI